MSATVQEFVALILLSVASRIHSLKFARIGTRFRGVKGVVEREVKSLRTGDIVNLS